MEVTCSTPFVHDSTAEQLTVCRLSEKMKQHSLPDSRVTRFRSCCD